jgi:hypothetical protein
MRGHKLKCGVWWQGVLKGKGVKQVEQQQVLCVQL